MERNEMNCKLHINLNQGLLEAEGSESFVLQVYNDFKEKLKTEMVPGANNSNTTFQDPNSGKSSIIRSTSKSKSPKSTPAKKTASGPTLQVVPDFSSGAMGKQFLTEVKKFANRSKENFPPYSLK